MFTGSRECVCREEDMLNIYYLIMPKSENEKIAIEAVQMRIPELA